MINHIIVSNNYSYYYLTPEVAVVQTLDNVGVPTKAVVQFWTTYIAVP